MNVKEQVKIDLADACDAIEHLAALIPDMSLKQKIDTAARLRGATKAADAIDLAIKDHIKKFLDGKDGIVQGGIFKAVLKRVQTTRLNQKLLKAEKPKVYEQYTEAKDEARITFEPR